MERDDLRQVMERLEAVAALSTLFKNLWYEKIKSEAASDKVRAYLTVYEDAVPMMNHIIQYAHYSATLLAEGRLDQDRYERLQMAFGQLGAALLGRDVDAGMEMPGLEDLESSVEITPEQEAEMEGDLFEAEDLRTVAQSGSDAEENMSLEGVSQDEVEALLTDTNNGAPGGIDSLFERSGSQDQVASSQEEIDALLDEHADETDLEDLDELLGEEGEPQPVEEEEVVEEHMDLEEAEEEVEAAEAEVEEAGEEDLTDLLDSLAEDNEEKEAGLDLGDLDLAETPGEEEETAEDEAKLDLGDLEFEDDKGEEEVELDLEADQGEAETDLDLSDLDLGEDKDDDAELDLSELLGEEKEEPPKPAPKAAPGKAAPAKAAAAPKAAAPAVVPKAAPAKAAPKAAPAKAVAAPKAAAPAVAPKAAPAKAAPKAAPAKNDKQDEESISQDEIDALFG